GRRIAGNPAVQTGRDGTPGTAVSGFDEDSPSVFKLFAAPASRQKQGEWLRRAKRPFPVTMPRAFGRASIQKARAAGTTAPCSTLSENVPGRRTSHKPDGRAGDFPAGHGRVLGVRAGGIRGRVRLFVH